MSFARLSEMGHKTRNQRVLSHLSIPNALLRTVADCFRHSTRTLRVDSTLQRNVQRHREMVCRYLARLINAGILVVH